MLLKYAAGQKNANIFQKEIKITSNAKRGRESDKSQISEGFGCKQKLLEAAQILKMKQISSEEELILKPKTFYFE